MKIRPVGAELLHADGRTEIGTNTHAVASGPFRNFANTPKKFTYLQALSGLNAEYLATAAPEFMSLFW